MNPKINTLKSQFPILILFPSIFWETKQTVVLTKKTEYERRNNRTNQRHWIQQGGSDHRSEERERNLRSKEWNPAEDDRRFPGTWISDRWSLSLALTFHFASNPCFRNREFQKEREAEAEFYGGQVGELGESAVRERPSWEAWQSDSHM